MKYILQQIRESVDSLCRDGADMQYMQQKPYNFTTNTLKAYLIIITISTSHTHGFTQYMFAAFFSSFSRASVVAINAASCLQLFVLHAPFFFISLRLTAP